MTPDLKAASAGLERWLEASALPIWWERGADRVRGGFFEAIDLEGGPVEADRRARVVARQIFVYAAAGLRGWAGPWRAALEHGLKDLEARFLRPDGFVRRVVGADGTPVDDRPTLYEQAFTLFALAAAFKALPERTDLRDKALRMLSGLQGGRRHPQGGFVELEHHPFQSNPHMHLFEAMLAWAEADADPRWARQADEIAELCLARFIDADSGVLREFFDADWRPAPGVDGRVISPGHQFEWSWLLEGWGKARGDHRARTAAQRLYRNGLRGVDTRRNVAIDELLDDFSVRSAGARLWPQTERIKAALSQAACEWAHPELRAECAHGAVRAVDGLRQYLDVAIEGLWRDKMLPEGGFVEEPAPASSFYHIMVAIDELRARAAEAGADRTVA